MEIKRLKKRQKFILFLLVCLIIIVIFLFFYINKLSQKEVNNTTTTPPTGPTTPPTGPTTPPTGPTTPPTGPTTPPTGPTTPPTNKWEKILWEIEKFISINPTSLQKIKDWVIIQNYPNSLAGVDLEGAEWEIIKKLPDNGKIEGLEKKVSADSPVLKYKDWVRLPSVEDGNCFLNSFSVLLTGKNADTSLALPLRVKICLEIMNNPNVFLGGGETEKFEELKTKLVGSHGFAKNGKWLENRDISYLSLILDRSITLISVLPGSEKFVDKDKIGILHADVLSHRREWVIYNSGEHFEPLIKK